MMQWIDPIVKEVRLAREKIWKECNYDINQLYELLKEKEKDHGRRVVHERELLRKKHIASTKES
jgi:hypothetical protein